MTPATPYADLSDELKEVFRHFTDEMLLKSVGLYLNIFWFKDKKTMDRFYDKAGARVTELIGPQRVGGAQQDPKTRKLIVAFFSETPLKKPGYKVGMEGVEMQSLYMYP